MAIDGSYCGSDSRVIGDALLKFAEDELHQIRFRRSQAATIQTPNESAGFVEAGEYFSLSLLHGDEWIRGQYIVVQPGQWAKLHLYGPSYTADTPQLLRLVEGLPFDYMTSGPVVAWGNPDPFHNDHYLGPSFGDGHDNHGWFSAFKGERGHARLASRRLLTYGPWRLIERPGDLSIIEYHDPSADPETALAQAKPGHRAAGLSTTGAFIHPSYTFDDRDYGTFHKPTQRLEQVVVNRDVTAKELRVFAAVKMLQPLTMHVEQVTWVFPDEATARRNLHLIWCWGMAVRTFVAGVETELTDGYEPPAPVVPDWVKKRRDQDGF